MGQGSIMHRTSKTLKEQQGNAQWRKHCWKHFLEPYQVTQLYARTIFCVPLLFMWKVRAACTEQEDHGACTCIQYESSSCIQWMTSFKSKFSLSMELSTEACPILLRRSKWKINFSQSAIFKEICTRTSYGCGDCVSFSRFKFKWKVLF